MDFRLTQRILLFMLLIALGVGLMFVQSAGVSATDFGIAEVDESIVLGSTNIIEIILNIIRVVLGLVGIILLGLILYAGFLWMTSEGEEAKITKAKQTIINAVIGLAIIMSAFAIVSFIINAFGNGEVDPKEPGGGTPPLYDFTGSGALGSAILDHYPFRNAQDVPRNTNIAITFRESLDPSTIMVNSNNTCFGPGTNGMDIMQCADEGDEDNISEKGDPNRPVYGDCLVPESGTPFNWATMCDALVTSSIAIAERDNENAVPITGAVIATYEDAGKTEIRTITIRPYEPLGSSIEKRWYRVQLSRDITNLEGMDIFRSHRTPYHWEFQADTVLDLTPPTITSVYPAAGQTISKNTIISLTFNKAVDPVMVQGMINTESNPFTNIIFGTTTIQGQWRVSNGYRTVEFVPSTPCDVVNSCGEVMYCLPVPGCGNNAGCTADYDTLVRTARLISNDTWEAYPFSGVYDMSGNALDGDADNIRDSFPLPPRPIDLQIFSTSTEQVPDNYWWSYSVKNDIDRRIPYPYEISPGVDAEQVRGDIPIDMLFNMPMFVHTLYSADNTTTLQITEYPPLPGGEGLWTYPTARMEPIAAGVLGNDESRLATKVTLLHREFGPGNPEEDTDRFYFTSITGGVRGVNQNCMYPGYGPAGVSGSVNDTCMVQDNGTVGAGCTPVSASDSDRDTGCAFTNLSLPSQDYTQAVDTTGECIDLLVGDSIVLD